MGAVWREGLSRVTFCPTNVDEILVTLAEALNLASLILELAAGLLDRRR